MERIGRSLKIHFFASRTAFPEQRFAHGGVVYRDPQRGRRLDCTPPGGDAFGIEYTSDVKGDAKKAIARIETAGPDLELRAGHGEVSHRWRTVAPPRPTGLRSPT